VNRTPSTADLSRRVAATAIAASTESRWFRWLKVSVARTTMLTARMPAAIARSYPRAFRTSADHSTPGLPETAVATCSASASAGTTSGRANPVTSTRRAPAATTRSIS
jgi:hypothetical protein